MKNRVDEILTAGIDMSEYGTSYYKYGRVKGKLKELLLDAISDSQTVDEARAEVRRALE